jgi:hypothetical protein
MTQDAFNHERERRTTMTMEATTTDASTVTKPKPAKKVTTLAELAKEVKMKPMKVRRILRAAPDIVRHKKNANWEFDADMLKKARAVLTAKQ